MEPFAAVPLAVPLVCDLDGTLVATDCSVRAFARAARNPAHWPRLAAAWPQGGRPALKAAAWALAPLALATLPWRGDVLRLVRAERARGRTIALATGSPQVVADAVAAHLGLFAWAQGTSGGVNLVGPAKLAAVRARLDGGAFLYAGDSLLDLPLLAASAGGLAHRRLRRRLRPWPPAKPLAFFG